MKNVFMIGALHRLQARQAPGQLPDSLVAFGIKGRRAGGLRRLFMNHPPLEERIAALEGAYT